MPIYEFRCTPQGHEFEAFVMASDEAIACPECGSPELERMMSSFASHTKSGLRMVAPAGPAPGAPAKRGCGGGCACH